jgi:glycosyltransferase involved in cell wall biosynthesis
VPRRSAGDWRVVATQSDGGVTTGTPPGRLGAGSAGRPAGVRVVLDARPLQAPDRSPVAATYLDALLEAYDADPLAGESFAFLLASDLDDPTATYDHLDIVARRQLPPTRLLRSGAMTVDPFVLRGAAVGAAWRAERGGAAGAVYHAVGSGPLPIASGLPVVVTLLDLAPWELPDVFGRTVVNRFGQRLRAQLLREAAAVIVGSVATARAARRVLRIRRERVHVVPLAPRPDFSPPAPNGAGADDDGGAGQALRERLGLDGGYLVFSGRFDARMDLGTLLSALADLARAGRPGALAPDVPWPPRILVVGASPEDRASVARAAARKGIGESFAYAPSLETAELVGLVRGARAVLSPVVSEAAGLAVIEALACGVPVVASAVGPLPELIGPAGLLVPPREPERLAVGLATIWADDAVHRSIADIALDAARRQTRGWADVANETRAVYAAVGTR